MFTFPELLVPAYVVPFGLSDTEYAGCIQEMRNRAFLEPVQLTRLCALHCRTVVAFMATDHGISLEIPKAGSTVKTVVERVFSIR